MAMQNRLFKNRRNKGFTLLEVLVALLLLGLGFASMLMLQYKSLQYSSISYYRGISSQIVSGLAAGMRANFDAMTSYDNVGGGYIYSPSSNITEPSPSCKGNTTCSPAQIAQADVYWARRAARAQLPGGDLYVKYDTTKQYYDVMVLWQDPENNTLTQLPCSGLGIAGLTPSTVCLSMRVSL